MSGDAELLRVMEADEAVLVAGKWHSTARTLHKARIRIEELTAHPPADSIEKAIGELPEGWKLLRLSGPLCDADVWECVLRRHERFMEVGGYGPTLLSAIRAAMERIPMKEEG